MAVTKREDRKFKFETLQLHVGQEQPDPATDARAVPIYQTTSYVFKNSAHAAARFELADAGNIYGRLTNSTQGVFEDRIAALEGGVAGLAVASGAAAFVTYIRAILLRDTGATISPFNAFLLLQGTETLSLRIDRHNENTKKVVEFLQQHPAVEKVNHPSLPDHPDHALYEKYFPNGGGSIFTFNIKGGVEEAHKFIDNLQVFSLLANVADVKSLVIHPATTTHSQLTEEELADVGIQPNTIRLSIGTEHIDDILFDLKEALDQI